MSSIRKKLQLNQGHFYNIAFLGVDYILSIHKQ